MLVSLLNGECVLYGAVAIVLFTSLEKHIDEASPPFLTMDVLKLFVLVFFGSFAFGVILGAWSPGVTTKQSISVCLRITRSSLCVSLHISRLPSHSSGVFVWDRVPLLPSVLAGKASGPLPIFCQEPLLRQFHVVGALSLWRPRLVFSLMVDVPVVLARCW